MAFNSLLTGADEPGAQPDESTHISLGRSIVFTVSLLDFYDTG